MYVYISTGHSGQSIQRVPNIVPSCAASSLYWIIYGPIQLECSQVKIYFVGKRAIKMISDMQIYVPFMFKIIGLNMNPDN